VELSASEIQSLL